MPTITRQRIRIAADAASFQPPLDLLRNAVPAFWRANDVQFEIGLFHLGVLQDVDNVASIALELREPGEDGAPPDMTVAPLLRVVQEGPFDNINGTDWTAGSHQHFTLVLTPEETRLRAGPAWLVLQATTDDSPPRALTLTAGPLRIVADGLGLEEGDPALPQPAYYTATAADARFARRAQNLLHNGRFDIWQRGTSFAASGFVADRWYWALGAGSAATVTRQVFAAGQTAVPADPAAFLRLTVATAGSEVQTLRQRVPSVRTGAGQIVTLSGYALASKTVNLPVQATQRFGSGGSSAVVTSAGQVAVGTAWAPFALSWALPSVAGKTIGSGEDDSLEVALQVPTSAGTVVLDVANLRLDLGEVPGEDRWDGPSELQRCLGFYRRVGGEGYAYRSFGVGFASASNNAVYHLTYGGAMRVAPVVRVSSPSDFMNMVPGGGYSCTAIYPSKIGRESCKLDISASGMSPGQVMLLQANNTAPALFEFEAEL